MTQLRNVLILGVLVLLILACSKTEEVAAPEVVRPVKTMKAMSAGSIAGLTLPGTVRASKRVELAFQVVGGRLIELPIAGREGEEVKKGELLARIDPKDFETELRRTKGRLNEAQADLKLAKKEFTRVQNIKKKDPGAISAADIDRKREAVSALEGRIRSIKAAVEDAQNRLNYTRLAAPFTGKIARRYVDNFQEVKPKEPILSLQDISDVEILVDVPENVVAIAQAEGVDNVKLSVEFPTSPGNQYDLSVKEFATTADPATQTFQAVLEMPQPEGVNILPGMTGTVTISGLTYRSTLENMVLIPAIAVVADPQGNNHVWVVDEEQMTVNKRDVKMGSLTGSENVKILEGLEGGETIVVAGVLKLKDGLKVRLWDQQ